MSFSVVTPSFNALPWIRSCIASVADQEGVRLQHIIQDGVSTDGTREYVLTEPRVLAESVHDSGMYEAVNRGWAKCTCEYVLHLNADEELLPGSLAAVGAYFEAHPDVDVVVTGTLICRTDGSLLCYRKPVRTDLPILLTSHLPQHTCSTFLRRSAFIDRPWLYDPKFRLVSDALLMRDVLQAGRKIGVLDKYTSIFLITGKNIGLTANERSLAESKYLTSLAPPWMSLLKPLIRLKFWVAKLLAGHYSKASITYEIYPPGQDKVRKSYYEARPSGVFRPEQTRE